MSISTQKSAPFSLRSQEISHLTAFFAPSGLGGFLFWYLLYPVHALVFRGPIKSPAHRAGNLADGDI